MPQEGIVAAYPSNGDNKRVPDALSQHPGPIKIFINGSPISSPTLDVGGVSMGMRYSKTNPNLVGLIQKLKEASRTNKAPVWRDIALRLEGPQRNWAEVNISKIDRYAGENEIVVVPGKILGSGEIAKKVTVAAYRFSGQAREKIEKAGGQNISIEELVATNPKGSGVRIMG
jgi:large subunit ribosomal protein L18e